MGADELLAGTEGMSTKDSGIRNGMDFITEPNRGVETGIEPSWSTFDAGLLEARNEHSPSTHTNAMLRLHENQAE